MSKTQIKPSLTRVNSIDITINEESHTITAPLVERLLEDPNCVFAAYKVGHPSDKFVSLTIQGNDNKNANKIFEDALKSIIKDIKEVIQQVKEIEE